jgi:hypothetical protein
MDPRDYLAFAARLTNLEAPTTVDLRTVVSRADCAAFNVAIDLLKAMGIESPHRWEGHKAVPFPRPGNCCAGRVAS